MTATFLSPRCPSGLHRDAPKRARAVEPLALPIVRRPAVRYHGGKWRLAPWIMSFYPAHECYVEPFAGGFSILLQKPPAVHEVMNDLNSDIVNFFRVLRENPAELIRAIELTPYSREEHAIAWEVSDNPLEKARRFYVRAWQSYGSPTYRDASGTGWRFQVNNTTASAVKSWNDTRYLLSIAERIKSVQIDHDDYRRVLARYDSPTSLFYCDPPYPHDARDRDGRKAYTHEMTDDQHREMATLLRGLEGMVIVSSYPNPLYDDLFGDWQRETKETIDINSQPKVECLWLSPNTVASLNKPQQMALELPSA